MKLLRNFCVAVGSVFVMPFIAHGSIINIDTFDSPGTVGSASATTFAPDSGLQKTGSGILGGERDLFTRFLTGDSADSVSIIRSSPNLIYLQSNGTPGFGTTTPVSGVAFLQYDGTDGLGPDSAGDTVTTDLDMVGLLGAGIKLGADITSNRFEFDIASISGGTHLFRVSLYDATNSATTGLIAVTTAGKLNIFASAFAGAFNPVTDIIGAITVEIFGPSIVSDGTSSLVINNFAIVPEPSSIALLGLGAIGLVAYRRRKRTVA